jgi:hypothetical protein
VHILGIIQFRGLIFPSEGSIFQRNLANFKRITTVRLTQEELIAGDHIYVKRKGHFYAHHGIYAGNGLVFHFKGAVKEKHDPTVIISDMATFLKNGKLKRRSYKRRLLHAETVQMARAHLDQKGYSLIFNNCEHFATYCATGKKKSPQVHKIFGSVATLTLAVTGLLIRKQRCVKKEDTSVS